MPTLALATAVASTGHDADLQPLLQACAAAGLAAEVRAWDDQTVSWSRFDAVLLRSPWDYTERLTEFLHWCTLVSSQTVLLNPLPVVRWNTDKHYLLQLAAQGVAVVPGDAFGDPRWVRLSYAASEKDLTRALDRITQFARKLESVRAGR